MSKKLKKSITKQMERVSFVNKHKVIVGVDIGSIFHYYQTKKDNYLDTPTPFKSDISGFNSFHDYINNNLQTDPQDVIVGLEPTGPFWEPFAKFLEEKGYTWVFVSQTSTKKYKQIQFNSSIKTDPIDAATIVSLLSAGHYLTHPNRTGYYRELYNLVKIRDQITKQQNVYYNYLYSDLSVYFPELLSIFYDITIKSIRILLNKYPTPEDIRKSSNNDIYQLIKTVRSIKLRRRRTHDIKNAADKSVGITEGIQSYKYHIKMIIKRLDELELEMKEIDDIIETILFKIPESKKILSIKSAGNYTAAVILSYFGDMKSYSSCYELIKFAGLNLCENSSGKRKGQKYISKRGPGQLRKILYLLTLRLISQDLGIKKKYEHYIENNKKCKMKAIVAIMCYLVKMIYSLCKNDTSYNENILIERFVA